MDELIRENRRRVPNLEVIDLSPNSQQFSYGRDGEAG